MKSKTKSKPILNSDDFFLLKKILDSDIMRAEKQTHWMIVSYMQPNEKYEGSALQGLHKETVKIKKALEKFCELFESQYRKV